MIAPTAVTAPTALARAVDQTLDRAHSCHVFLAQLVQDRHASVQAGTKALQAELARAERAAETSSAAAVEAACSNERHPPIVRAAVETGRVERERALTDGKVLATELASSEQLVQALTSRDRVTSELMAQLLRRAKGAEQQLETLRTMRSARVWRPSGEDSDSGDEEPAVVFGSAARAARHASERAEAAAAEVAHSHAVNAQLQTDAEIAAARVAREHAAERAAWERERASLRARLLLLGARSAAPRAKRRRHRHRPPQRFRHRPGRRWRRPWRRRRRRRRPARRR